MTSKKPAPAKHSRPREIRRIGHAEALRLFSSEDIFGLAARASRVAAAYNGTRAYYVRNMHVNPTNLCINRCAFCAFSRSRGQEGAYELTIPEIIKNLRRAMPLSEVHIVGGLHPDWPFAHYLKMLASIRKSFPALHIKAFTAAEVDYMVKLSSLTLPEVLRALKQSGLGSMPGGGAEIFDPAVRGRLCPEKISGQRWLEVMEAAHLTGLKTNATMLYGHLETHEERVDHLMKLRELQDRTGGFQAFIPLPYQPVEGVANAGAPASGLDDLRTIAVSRLVLDNFPHIKAYWVMLGDKVSQLALRFGADDLDGTIVLERISHAAGGKSRRGISAEELELLIKRVGRKPVERDSFYKPVRRARKA